MRGALATLIVLAVPLSSFSADLTTQQIADGWLMLFDGATTFGWKVDGEAKVENGKLVLGGTKPTTVMTTTEWGGCELAAEFEPCPGAGLQFHHMNYELKAAKEGVNLATVTLQPTGNSGYTQKYQVRSGGVAYSSGGGEDVRSIQRHRIGFTVPEGKTLVLSRVWLRPLGLESIFNGKDLTGWKVFPDRKSKFSVTSEGWLNVKDGPGDLATVEQYADFTLQLECISNGDFLNSGIFFRCIPDQYQQGYEAQIRNQFVGGDRTKPFDFGTGAIYRRVAARKVVPNDKEWFTMTVIAHGNHIATWVNGYQTTDFTDDRPEADNARKGSKLSKGTISIQGHDPTTDLSFRNFRIAELPAIKK